MYNVYIVWTVRRGRKIGCHLNAWRRASVRCLMNDALLILFTEHVTFNQPNERPGFLKISTPGQFTRWEIRR